MSKWTEFVKAYAEKHKVSYKQAMKDAAASYEKGEKKESKPREPKEKKEPKTKHEKAETPMMEKAEHKDALKVTHENKKREGAAASLKPRKLAQLG